jgi:hypothetical protein
LCDLIKGKKMLNFWTQALKTNVPDKISAIMCCNYGLDNKLNLVYIVYIVSCTGSD